MPLDSWTISQVQSILGHYPTQVEVIDTVSKFSDLANRILKPDPAAPPAPRDWRAELRKALGFPVRE